MKKIPLEALNIELADNTGRLVKLADYLGKYVVLYFYPKDDTPGCTAEACSFRDTNDEIRALGAEVIGVSKDDLKSHQRFTEKFKLKFTLLSDPEKKLQEAFGVWQKKKFMGKEYMGTLRTTFIIDPKGEVVREFENVKPVGHAEAVLQELKLILAKD
jgi:peroxiredoxin Q/BCP